MNCCDVSGSNLNGVTIPASSSSSNMFSDVISKVLFQFSDRKLSKVMKRKTNVPNKQQHQPQMQQRQLLEQNQSTQTALQDPFQAAAFIQQNVVKLMGLMQELERQLVALQGESVETISEARLQQFVLQLLQQIQHFMHQVNQLPLVNKSSAFSTIPQGQCNSREVSPATDDKIPALSNDVSKGSDISSTAYYHLRLITS